MDAVETITEQNAQIDIYYDECPESPREWDNLGTMALFHRRYDVPNEDNLTPEECNRIVNSADYICLNVYMYDHSGVSLNTTGFSCPWDSGQLGIIFVHKNKVREEFDVRRITKSIREKVIQNLKTEVEQYGLYLDGQVFQVVKTVDGEVVESCGGFIGIESAQEYANELKKNNFSPEN